MFVPRLRRHACDVPLQRLKRTYRCRSAACELPAGPSLGRHRIGGGGGEEPAGGRARAVLGGRPQVRVGVQRGGGLGVSQGALDGDDVAAGGDQPGGVEVPEVVERQVGGGFAGVARPVGGPLRVMLVTRTWTPDDLALVVAVVELSDADLPRRGQPGRRPTPPSAADCARAGVLRPLGSSTDDGTGRGGGPGEHRLLDGGRRWGVAACRRLEARHGYGMPRSLSP